MVGLLISGVMCIIPISALEAIFNLPPFDIWITAEVRIAVCRLDFKCWKTGLVVHSTIQESPCRINFYCRIRKIPLPNQRDLHNTLLYLSFPHHFRSSPYQGLNGNGKGAQFPKESSGYGRISYGRKQWSRSLR